MGNIPAISTRCRPAANAYSAGVLDVFKDEISTLLNNSVSDNTKQVYNQALTVYMGFLREYSLSQTWPPTLVHLVQFVAYLSKFKNCSHSTINAYLSGISFFLKLYNLQDFTRAFIIQKMLTGLRRARPNKDSRMPITIDILKQIQRALLYVAVSNYETVLFSTAYLIAFFGFLRVSEIAVEQKQGDITKVVLYSDTVVSEKQCALTIRSSKTDQFAKSATLIFTQSRDTSVCPFSHLQQYLKLRPDKSGPLFCHFSGEPLTKYQFRAMLSKCLKFGGIKSNIKSHSFRIGAATYASTLGVPDEEIKHLGRWSTKGETHRRYIRLESIIP